jgi:Flp pilus assembly protein TadD
MFPEVAIAVLGVLTAADYSAAIADLRTAAAANPTRPQIRKELGYTLLKAGETAAARDAFAEAMRLDPADLHAALEYAFLCHETQMRAEARRIFDRVRKSGESESARTAARAFDNIDKPLAEGIARWRAVAEANPGNFAAHHELARLADDRDELDLAASSYRSAWRVLPERRYLLLDLGRVLSRAGRDEESNGAFLAALYGPEPRASENARAALPSRFAFANEFRRALELDPSNVRLRRDLAFLLLKVGDGREAEAEFTRLLDVAPADQLACAQLGLIYRGRDEATRARPLLDCAINGPDPAIANKVRAVLGLQRASDPVDGDARAMAIRSLEAGYLVDAARYLERAHSADRTDPWIQLQLGQTYNLLHNDREAVKWFRQARSAADPAISAEATRAYRNLQPELASVRTTAWAFPVWSSRWKDAFAYGQVKTEWRTKLPIRPYLSTRLLGNLRGRANIDGLPRDLSESSLVVAAGVATKPWNGAVAWWESGRAVSYLGQGGRPDHRGGVSFARAARGVYETNLDALFISRFGNDTLLYSQHRIGRLTRSVQPFLAVNAVADAKRQGWANFIESGPGVRFRLRAGLAVTLSYVRGLHLIDEPHYRNHLYGDFRIGVGYAITR